MLERTSGDSPLKPWYRRWWGVVLLAILTLTLSLAVAMAFYVANKVQELRRGGLEPATLTSAQKFEATEGAADRWLGSAKPKITIVEFADFACPFSLASFPKIRELGTKYRGLVKVVFRDYAYLTEYSTDLALAARCAGEQGLFWPMHDKLYQNQGVSTREEITGLAARVGLDMDRFTACFDSKKYLAEIQKDHEDADRFGIKGTPTWFINGYKIEGDFPLKLWEEIINKFSKN